MNILYNTDSYKGTHHKGIRPGVKYIYSYLESRGGKYDEIPLLGIEKFIAEVLKKQITKDDVLKAEKFWLNHVGMFNKEGWMRIVEKHNGFLPINFYSLPEGTIFNPGIPVAAVMCNDIELPWLSSFIETVFLRTIWYPSTVGARIREMKRKIKKRFIETCDTLDSLPFALLDFSSRGTQSLESSEIGGYAYLTQFLGSDNVPAVHYVNEFFKVEMSGFSVAATEHSIMCSYGEENEKESFEYLLENMVQPGGILSVVSDTWNIFKAAEYWAELADKVKAKDVKLVFRPDSGTPKEVITRCLPIFEEAFGFTVNSKGYKVLKNIKILWGDGIDENTCVIPFDIAISMGFAAENILTGSGGGLMSQDITRDTCKFAVKASAMFLDGKWVGISKNPITDSGKKSKEGRFNIVKNTHGNLEVKPYLDHYTESDEINNLLKLRISSGYRPLELIPSLELIRERCSV